LQVESFFCPVTLVHADFWSAFEIFAQHLSMSAHVWVAPPLDVVPLVPLDEAPPDELAVWQVAAVHAAPCEQVAIFWLQVLHASETLCRHLSAQAESLHAHA
jgi:hypothetical protein